MEEVVVPIAISMKIREAFLLFDAENSDMISKKEVPSAIRYLGVYPKEREINAIIESMQDDEPNEGFVTFRDFDREMKRVLMDKNPSYEPASADLLLQAFRCLDSQGLGYVEGDALERLLVTNGEAFRPQELDDFYMIAKDPDTGRVFYEDYVGSTAKGR